MAQALYSNQLSAEQQFYHSCSCVGWIAGQRMNYLNTITKVLPVPSVFDIVPVADGQRCYEYPEMMISAPMELSCDFTQHQQSTLMPVSARSATLHPYGTHKILPLGTCNPCDKQYRARVIEFIEKMAGAHAAGMNQLVMKMVINAINSTVAILQENNYAPTFRTPAEDGVQTFDATATGGLTFDIVTQIIYQLSAAGADTSDIVFIIPRASMDEIRTSIKGELAYPGVSAALNELTGANYIVYNGVHFMFVQKESAVFKANAGTPAGIVAYAVTRQSLALLYQAYETPLPYPAVFGENTRAIMQRYGAEVDPYNGSLIAPGMSNFVVSPTHNSERIGVSVRIESYLTVMRSRFGGVARIVLPAATKLIG